MVGSESDVGLLLSVRSENSATEKSREDMSAHIAPPTKITENTTTTTPLQHHSPDQSPNLQSLDVVQLLDGLLDLPLVALQVDDEHQRVVLLDLLHGGLGVQGVLDGPELVHPRQVVDRFTRVSRGSGQGEGLGSVERDRGSDLADRGRVGTLQGGLLGGLGLDIGGLAGGCDREFIEGKGQLTSCACARTGAQGDERGASSRGDARRGETRRKTTRTRPGRVRRLERERPVQAVRARKCECVCAYVRVVACSCVRVRADGRVGISTLTCFQSCFHPSIIVAQNRPR